MFNRCTVAALLGLAVLSSLPSAARAAEAVERNLPPLPQRATPEILAPNALPAAQDAAPLGANLSAVVILGAEDAVVQAAPRAAVDTGRVAALDRGPVQAELSQFIGKPISRRLIAEMEAVIARAYREQGFPFVAISTPPQEITSGVVQLRIVEFRAGKIAAKGNKRASPDDIVGGVRLKSGDRIDARALAQDLDWLNRNPFRNSEAVFSPGATSGESDLDLRVSEVKPWQVYAGYANSGAPSTKRDRLFVGATIADLPITDALLSYQLTGSSDFWYHGGQVFGEARHPTYVSHGLRALLPTGARQNIELTLSAVESNQTVDPFPIRQQTYDGSLGYRTALSNLVSLPGDIFGGAEAGHQNRDIFFLGTVIVSQAIDTYQLYAGWSDAWRGSLGSTSVNAALHVSPGGITDRNSSAALSTYSSGRVTNATYAYTDFDVTQRVGLGNGYELVAALSGQLTNRALPETRQMGIYGVRGYSSDDGSFDLGATIRNELRFPGLSPLSGVAPVADEAAPFVFIDAGYAREKSGGNSASPVSAGVGADYRLGAAMSSNIAVGYAFRDAGLVKSGDVHIDFRISVTY